MINSNYADVSCHCKRSNVSLCNFRPKFGINSRQRDALPLRHILALVVSSFFTFLCFLHLLATELSLLLIAGLLLFAEILLSVLLLPTRCPGKGCCKDIMAHSLRYIECHSTTQTLLRHGEARPTYTATCADGPRRFIRLWKAFKAHQQTLAIRADTKIH